MNAYYDVQQNQRGHMFRAGGWRTVSNAPFATSAEAYAWAINSGLEGLRVVLVTVVGELDV